jgi:thiol-disulfide isomerase/thioredoxin
MLVEMKTKFLYLVGIVIGLLVLLRFIRNSQEGFSDMPKGADTFTLYYADWCPHCKTVKPMFQEWAKNGFVTVAGRNVACRMVQPEKEPEKAQGKDIKGYPTFMLETADGKSLEYQGDRTPDGWIKFLEENLKGLQKAQS